MFVELRFRWVQQCFCNVPVIVIRF